MGWMFIWWLHPEGGTQSPRPTPYHWPLIVRVPGLPCVYLGILKARGFTQRLFSSDHCLDYIISRCCLFLNEKFSLREICLEVGPRLPRDGALYIVVKDILIGNVEDCSPTRHLCSDPWHPAFSGICTPNSLESKERTQPFLWLRTSPLPPMPWMCWGHWEQLNHLLPMPGFNQSRRNPCQMHWDR